MDDDAIGWAVSWLSRYAQLRAAGFASGDREARKSAILLADALIDAARVLEATPAERVNPRAVHLELALPCTFVRGASNERFTGKTRAFSVDGLVVEGLPEMVRGTAGILELKVSAGSDITLACDVVSRRSSMTVVAISVMADDHRLRFFDLLFTELRIAERLPHLVTRGEGGRPSVRRRSVSVGLGSAMLAETLPRLLALRGFEVGADVSLADIVVSDSADVTALLAERRRGAALVLVHPAPRHLDVGPPEVFVLEGSALPSKAADLVSTVDSVLGATS